jgi:hypothetical protein
LNLCSLPLMQNTNMGLWPHSLKVNVTDMKIHINRIFKNGVDLPGSSAEIY